MVERGMMLKMVLELDVEAAEGIDIWRRCRLIYWSRL